MALSKFNYRAQIIEINLLEELELLLVAKKIYHLTFKGCVHVPAEVLSLHVIISKGKLLKRVLKQRVGFEMRGLGFSRNDKFFEIFDRKFQQLFTAGLIDQSADFWFTFMNPKRYEHFYVHEPEVLTMKDLEAGFVIWLISIFLTLIVFLLELLVKFRDRLVFQFVVFAFYHQANLSPDVPENRDNRIGMDKKETSPTQSKTSNVNN